jgi:hypothetical protein
VPRTSPLPPAPTTAERAAPSGRRNLHAAARLERLPAACSVSPAVCGAARPGDAATVAAVLRAAASPLAPRVRPPHVARAAGHGRRRCCRPASRVHVHHVTLPACPPAPLHMRPPSTRLRCVRARGVAGSTLGHDAVQADGQHRLCADGVAPAPLELRLQRVLAQLRQEVGVVARRGRRGRRGREGRRLAKHVMLRAAAQAEPQGHARPRRSARGVRGPAAGGVAGRVRRVAQGPQHYHHRCRAARPWPHRGARGWPRATVRCAARLPPALLMLLGVSAPPRTHTRAPVRPRTSPVPVPSPQAARRPSAQRGEGPVEYAPSPGAGHTKRLR